MSATTSIEIPTVIYRASRGLSGSIHHYDGCYLTEAEAEAEEGRMVEINRDQHTSCGTSVSAERLSPAARRVLRALALEGAFEVREGATGRDRRPDYRREVKSLVRAGAINIRHKVEVEEGAPWYREAREWGVDIYRLTAAGRAWLGLATPEGGAE